MYTVKSGICVLSPDMFIGMRNKQEACEYTPLHDCTLKVEKSTLEENYEKCPPLDQFLDTRLVAPPVITAQKSTHVGFVVTRLSFLGP